MSSTLAKIAEIEAEMARTQKNKATAHHLGLLKARLAKLRRELITPKGGGGGGPGEGSPMFLPWRHNLHRSTPCSEWYILPKLIKIYLACVATTQGGTRSLRL
uniref:Developmentally regulated GTP binding protein 1 n=1 Tax=Gorilla gorilla gorilla TaxID=9595 RepID=A0A2I2ZR46_GORGO